MKNTMKSLTQLVAAAALGTAAMTAIAAPANAGVSVGIGIGVPGPAVVAPPPRGPHWCYRHPGACRGYGPAYGPPPPVPAFVVGNFYQGRGWWDGHSWYHDRYRFHGGWRYR